MAQGKTVKILCVGKKGYDVLRRQFAAQIIELIELRAVRTLGFDTADMIAQQGHRAVRRRRVRRRDDVLLALPVGDPADPDGAAGHPGRDPEASAAHRRFAPSYEYEPEESEILASAAAAQYLGAGAPGAARERRVRARARR